MFYLRKHVSYGICISLLFIAAGRLFAEDMTITTYYPSPNGSYDALSVKRLSVGDTNADGSIDDSDVSASSGYLLVADKVGIGTTAPNAKLTVSNNVYTAPLGSAYSQYQLLLYDGGSSASTAYGMGIESYNIGFNSNGGYKFYQSGGSTPLMVIGGASGTNVGIGTASPSSPLEVYYALNGNGLWLTSPGYDTDSLNAGLRFHSTSNSGYQGDIVLYHRGSSDPGLDIWGYPYNSTPSCCVPIAHFSNNGNVGIGTTSPAAKLEVAGAIRTAAGQNFKIRYGSGSVTVSQSANTGATYASVSFGYTFTSTPVVFVTGNSAGTNYLDFMLPSAKDPSTTGFTLYLANSGSSTASGTYNYNWIAIGD